MRIEADLQDNEARKVYGQGTSGRPFTRKFRNAASMNSWLEGDGADLQIFSIERA
jgi:hypothetical protein